jgi:hypothetical protein
VSIEVMAAVWRSDVPAPMRMTLLALADSADDNGLCWPSVRTLAAKCQAGESTVRRHLQALEADGLLASRQRFNQSSLYRINVAGVLARKAEPPKTRSAPPADPFQDDTPSQPDTGPDLTPPVDLTPGPDLSGPPPDLSSTPSQSEHLTVSEPSVEPSSPLRGDARATREGPGAIRSDRARSRRRSSSVGELAKTARSGRAHALVEAYAADCKLRPGPRLLTTLGVEVDVLLTRGWPEEVLADCIEAWAGKGLGPSAFQSVANEVANSRPPAARASPPRVATADQRFADAQALKERRRARLNGEAQVIDMPHPPRETG